MKVVCDSDINYLIPRSMECLANYGIKNISLESKKLQLAKAIQLLTVALIKLDGA